MANSLFLLGDSGAAARYPGAIIGENPAPFGAAQLNFVAFAPDILSTGDLTIGDAGDMSYMADFAVEFWFMANSAPGANVQIVRGPISAALSGAAEWVFTYKTDRRFAFAACDTTGTTRVANGASAIATDSFYHIVGTAEGGMLRLYINGVQDGADVSWGPSAVMPSGVGGPSPGTYDMRVVGPPTAGANQFTYDNLATYGKGLAASRVLEHYNAGVNRGYTFQRSGERIGAVLDTVSHTAPRSLQAGTRSVLMTYMTGQAPLEEMRTAVEAEEVDAAMFVTKNGTIRYLQDGHRSSAPYNTSQMTAGDAGGSEIPYEDLDIDFSPTELVNEWNVTRRQAGPATAITQTASDASSISRYFKRSRSLSDVPFVGSDSISLTIASSLLAKYKEPLQRVKRIDFVSVNENVTEAFLARELMDKVTVIRTPPGPATSGSSYGASTYGASFYGATVSRISQDVWIQGIDLSGSSDGRPWQMSWNVSPV